MNKKWLALIIMCSMGLVGGWYYYTARTVITPSIPLPAGFEMRTCSTEEEKNFIRKQFKENWGMLISTPSYDSEYFINKRGTYPFQKEYEGTMQIKVLYKDGVKVGFCAYYMKTPLEGDILFITTDKDHRGKRYAEQLVKYATYDLQRLGAHFIRFSTSEDNLSAQKLYDRLGYERIPGDKHRVWYRYSFK